MVCQRFQPRRTRWLCGPPAAMRFSDTFRLVSHHCHPSIRNSIRPHHTSPRLAKPRLTIPVLAKPALPLQTVRCPTRPFHATPRLSCPTSPDLRPAPPDPSGPYPTSPAMQTKPCAPSPTTSDRATPFLPRLSRPNQTASWLASPALPFLTRTIQSMRFRACHWLASPALPHLSNPPRPNLCSPSATSPTAAPIPFGSTTQSRLN